MNFGWGPDVPASQEENTMELDTKSHIEKLLTEYVDPTTSPERRVEIEAGVAFLKRIQSDN